MSPVQQMRCAMKDLNLKSKITNQLQQVQLPDQLIIRLDNQDSAIEVQLMLVALDSLAEQWH